jgi:hypothetical protein
MPLPGSFESSQQNKSQNRVKNRHSEQHFTHFPTKKESPFRDIWLRLKNHSKIA